MALDLPTMAIFLLIGVLEVVSVWFVNRRIKFEHDFMIKRGTVGEQFGDWLMEKESDAEDTPTRLEALSHIVGKTLFRTQRFSDQQAKSVDVRHFNTVDKKVFEAMQENDPQVRIAARILEELGLGDLVNEKDLPYVIGKYGKSLGFDGVEKTSRSKEWKLHR